jgi:hypothetical protein
MSRSDPSQGQTPVVRRNQMSKTVRMAMLVVAGVAVVSVTHSLVAFNLLGRAWAPGAVTWESGLGPASGLANGAGSWDACAGPAFAAWNGVLAPAGVSFVPVPATTTPGAPDMVNSMFFADDLFGTPFGEQTLAMEQSWAITPPGGGIKTSVESDIAFNNAKAFNCYPGPLRPLGPEPEGPAGAIDLFRVVLHELGHAWGLGHPDDIGQALASVMNSFISDTDVLQGDDISGVLTNYGIAVTSIPFPPRDQVLDFFLALEAEYRDGLGRQQNNPGFVDAEGSAVWFPEWLRYVLNACSPEDAASRVLLQIRGQGIQPVCGVVPPGVIAFPARNLSVDFLVILDNFYRDELGRGVLQSYIDAEGKAVWLQEYLRYRVNGCGHDTALANVLTQIRGGGIPPVCAT